MTVIGVISLGLIGVGNSAQALAVEAPPRCNGVNQSRTSTINKGFAKVTATETWTNWRGYYSVGRGGYAFTYTIKIRGGGLSSTQSAVGYC